MTQPQPFPKLRMDMARHQPAAPWSLWRTAVFLAAYCGWFAGGFWLGCWVRSWLW